MRFGTMVLRDLGRRGARGLTHGLLGAMTMSLVCCSGSTGPSPGAAVAAPTAAAPVAATAREGSAATAREGSAATAREGSAATTTERGASSATAPPQTTARPASAAAAPAPTDHPAAAANESATDASKSSSQTETPGQSGDPVLVLTAPAMAFIVDYANSDPAAAAQADCQNEKEKKKDEGAEQICLQKARDRFQPDVLRFHKGDRPGRFRLTIYKRNGESLREVSTGLVELTEASTTSVRVKFLGAERGARPLFKGQREAALDVPNNYSLEIQDPHLGRLRYDAKVGLVAE